MRLRMYQGRRKVQKLALQAVMFILLVIVILLVKRLIGELLGTPMSVKYPDDQLSRNFDKYITKYENNYWKKADVKNIVIWTAFFGGWGWLQDAQSSMKSCPVKCEVTNDRLTVAKADAVVFHANDLWKHAGLLGTIHNTDADMPTTRTPNQAWVVVSWEPMIYMWGKIKPHTFNWTALYRRESTIYNPFTFYFKMTPEEMKASPKPVENRNYFKEKKKFATTLVSNCQDQAKRYRIIRELQKYIDLDYFGKCSGNVNCPRGVPTAECGKKYMVDYKFYLAFENSFCRDYVSEKFWNALDRRQIPVIGAPKYNLEILPPNSYLNVFDFPTIEALANRMIEIGNNETLYNSFFDWLPSYKTDHEAVYCKICRELHANKPAQSYADMEGWIKDDICYKSTSWSLVSGFFDRLMFDMGLS